MKKLKVLLVGVLCVIFALGLSGCGKKKNPISVDEFKSTMNSKNFSVVSSKSSYSQYKEIKESYIAMSPDYTYQIEFIVLDSDSSASSMYNTNKNKFEQNKSSSKNLNTSIELANYSKYTLLSDAKYKVVSRIDNTLIYLDVDAEYKDNIDSILNEIGY